MSWNLELIFWEIFFYIYNNVPMTVKEHKFTRGNMRMNPTFAMLGVRSMKSYELLSGCWKVLYLLSFLHFCFYA